MHGKSTNCHNTSFTKTFFHFILSVFVLRGGPSFGVLSFWKARKPFSYQYYFHQLLGGKKTFKGICLFLKTPKWTSLPLSPNPHHSCKNEKKTQIKSKHSTNFLLLLFVGDEPYKPFVYWRKFFITVTCSFTSCITWKATQHTQR